MAAMVAMAGKTFTRKYTLNIWKCDVYFSAFYLLRISLWLLSSVCSRFDVYLYHGQKIQTQTHMADVIAISYNHVARISICLTENENLCAMRLNHIILYDYYHIKKKRKNSDSVRAQHTTQQRHHVIQRQMKMHTHRWIWWKKWKKNNNTNEIEKRKTEQAKGVQIIHYLFIMRVTFVTLRSAYSIETAFSAYVGLV